MAQRERRKEAAVEPMKQLEQQQDEEEDVLKLEQLEGNGVTAGDLQKLRDAGLHSVPAVAYTTKKALLAVRQPSINYHLLRNIELRSFGEIDCIIMAQPSVCAEIPSEESLVAAARLKI